MPFDHSIPLGPKVGCCQVKLICWYCYPINGTPTSKYLRKAEIAPIRGVLMILGFQFSLRKACHFWTCKNQVIKGTIRCRFGRRWSILEWWPCKTVYLTLIGYKSHVSNQSHSQWTQIYFVNCAVFLLF